MIKFSQMTFLPKNISNPNKKRRLEKRKKHYSCLLSGTFTWISNVDLIRETERSLKEIWFYALIRQLINNILT